MIIKMLKKSGNLFAYVILLFASLISLLPFYFMLIMSTYSTADIMTGIKLLPGTNIVENFSKAISTNFVESYLNSIVVSVAAIIGCVIISTMAGYGFTIYKFRFKKFIYSIVLATMMIPFSVGLIGYMIEMRLMGLTNTLAPMICIWFAKGFGVFWMNQYMKGSLQVTIVESARIDGSNELKTFLLIVLPNIVPAVITLSLLIFLWSWNQYLIPLTFINNPHLNTIPIYIKSLASQHYVDYAAQIAGLLLATIPMLLLFITCSKTFIKGLTAGALKG